MKSELTKNSPLTVLPGIGEKKAEAFKNAGIGNLGDLACFTPIKYRVNKLTRFIDASIDEPCGFCFTVLNEPSVSYRPGGKRLLRFSAGDDSGKVSIIYFNQVYLKNRFVKGGEYFFYGTLKKKNSNYYLFSPEFCDMKDFREGIVPIYRKTDGLSQNAIISATGEILPMLDALVSPMPYDGAYKSAFSSRADLVRALHRPKDLAELASARQEQVFEEMFLFSLKLKLLKKKSTSSVFPSYEKPDMEPFFSALGFEMTPAQRRATDDVIADLTDGRGKKSVMNRLIQGDVGSGKTAVAAAAVYVTVKNGKNAVLMAPTEILATQHRKSLGTLFAKLGIRVLLLTGSTPKKEREIIEHNLSGEGRYLIIGTHALIEDKADLGEVGLVITDEQHRFGVKQRARLAEKASDRNMLFMSATPIPRTLALFLFADKDISVIDTLPPGRKKIETYRVNEKMRPRIDAFIEKQVAEGHQVYVVCPLIEESDALLGVASAEVTYKRMKERFPQMKIGYIHGKMKPDEKQEIMTSFASGETDVLVSTTVIEVGINVPNATLMLIENAERFGLSALHQLRGRVGRGSDRSYCVLISSDDCPRLEIMTKTDDGFALAEADLKMRGPGEFFGARQTGRFELLPTGTEGSVDMMKLIADSRSAAEKYAVGLTDREISRYISADESILN